ncbi:hypothetical protein [Caulobacter henricii]|uniref:Uncharacterized protein n=1 Tax=Caulobacter henricii TaxID=69395 RepID=A0A0P0P487_9CAUL|nr:hypothetical protein [Caulobacter henricii]ALL15432.1 hypothetical protein AQ619_18260 [Caulobacter henricii]
MKAIETIWKGYRFRSRTEALWAVFLEALGVQFDYEPEGLLLTSGPYLPDFRLRDFKLPAWVDRRDVWLEIKGTEPTDEERQRCAELAMVSGCQVLLAVGPPDFAEQVYLFDPMVEDGLCSLMSLMVGRLGFMDIAVGSDIMICVGRGPRAPMEEGQEEQPAFREAYNTFSDPFCRVLGMYDGRVPADEAKVGVGKRTRDAYDKSRSARFEFGQVEPRWQKPE